VGNSGLSVQNDNSGLNNLGYKDEPFVLAKDMNLLFYVKDISTKPKKEKTMTQTMSQSTT
jgi:hypothetical protein